MKLRQLQAKQAHCRIEAVPPTSLCKSHLNRDRYNLALFRINNFLFTFITTTILTYSHPYFSFAMQAFIVTLVFLFSVAQGAVLLREESLFSHTATQTTRTARDVFSPGSNDTQRPLLSVLKNAILARSSLKRLAPSRRQDVNTSPTPAPTGPDSPDTTVHITNSSDFAILIPRNSG